MFFGGMFLFLVSLHDPIGSDRGAVVGLIAMLGGYVLYSFTKLDKRVRRLEEG